MHILYVYNSVEFEYHDQKAKSNLRKHGVSFSEAATALHDPRALCIEDPDAEDENRWILWGMSDQTRLLAVVYTLRKNRVRIISARKATRNEAKDYA